MLEHVIDDWFFIWFLLWQQIGAEIGRGGFGVVFQALNVEVGDFVAIKRFPLNAIDAESLGSIEVLEFWCNLP